MVRSVFVLSLVLTGLVSTAMARDLAAWKRPLSIPFPAEAPYSPLVATLGKMLYFDVRVSGAQNMSCASCHDPSFGWEAPVATAVGAMNVPLKRHSPTVLNLAWSDRFFWDGRAASLEEQAAGPITASVEMNSSLAEVVARVGAVSEYADGFRAAFPGEGLTESTLLTAIATYERTIVSGWSPFDRWVEGDEAAVSEAAKRGFDLFVGKAHCAECHSGWNFTDNLFHDIGLDTTDIGREAVASGEPGARHAFKTPGLRNIAHRAPFMHNGSLDTLEAVIGHYITGGADRPSRSPEMLALDLMPGDVDDLLAFLQSLTAEEAAVAAPVLPVN